MKMYREKEYSKSVHFWIEVVCKNMVDAFPQLSSQLLALLVEVSLVKSLSNKYKFFTYTFYSFSEYSKYPRVLTNETK